MLLFLVSASQSTVKKQANIQKKKKKKNLTKTKKENKGGGEEEQLWSIFFHPYVDQDHSQKIIFFRLHSYTKQLDKQNCWVMKKGEKEYQQISLIIRVEISSPIIWDKRRHEKMLFFFHLFLNNILVGLPLFLPACNWNWGLALKIQWNFGKKYCNSFRVYMKSTWVLKFTCS